MYFCWFALNKVCICIGTVGNGAWRLDLLVRDATIFVDFFALFFSPVLFEPIFVILDTSSLARRFRDRNLRGMIAVARVPTWKNQRATVNL